MIVYVVFPQHKMAVVFDPVFSWLKRDKAPDDPSQLSYEFFKVNTNLFCSNSLPSYCVFSELH